jgi:hypothetical protein
MTTYKDLIDALVDFLGANNTKEGERFARRAVLNAYTAMATGHSWQYYWNRMRLITVPSQTAGTIQYIDATRICTLTPDGIAGDPQTFPSAATLPFYNLILDSFILKIAARIDPLNLLVDPSTPLGYDQLPGSAYTLYRDTYPCPSDFRTGDELINLNNTGPLNYLHPREWLTSQRLRRGPATPRIYTFIGDTNYFGTMECKLFPAPDITYEFDCLYQRLPRPIVITEYNAGLVSSVSGSPTITGSGTAWSASMIGSVIRLSYDTINIPTGLGGLNPAAFEAIITAVNSPTSITIGVNAPLTLTGVKESISDPIDIEPGAMSVFMMRECEKQMRILRRMRSLPEENAVYMEAQTKAWEADARNIGRRAAGMSLGFPQRLANMPRGVDVS